MVGRTLSPLSGCCCCRRARRRRCSFPPGRRQPGAPAASCPVFVLRLWSFLRAMHLGVEVPLVCAPHTACCHMRCAPPLFLGFSVSWVLLVRCSPLHKLRSLCQASDRSASAMWKRCGTQGRLRWCVASRHVPANCGTLFLENLAVGDVARRRVAASSCCVASDGVWSCGVAWWCRCVVSQRVLCCVVWRLGGVVLCRALVLPCRVVCCFVVVGCVV